MERIDEPYRDPRTAGGRAAGMPQEFAARPAAPPATAPAAAPAAAPPKVGAIGRAANVVKSIASPIGLLAGGAIEGAWQGANTSTDAYYRRLGMDPRQAGANGFKDLAARGIGVLSDVGAGILDVPMGAVNFVRDFAGAEKLPTFGENLRANDGPSAGIGAGARFRPAPAGAQARPSPAGDSTAGAGRGFVNPEPANPNAPSPAATAPGAIMLDGNSYRGQGIAFGADIRTPAGALRNAGSVTSLDTSEGARQDQLELQRNAAERAAAPPSIAAGFGGSGGYGLLDNDVRRRRELEMAITSTPSNLTPPRQARAAAESAAKSLGDLNRSIEDRPIKRAALENSRGIADLQAGTQLRVAGINAGTSRDVAGIQGATSREVAGIGADARTTAAETAANARAAAAEARANTPKFMAIGLPDTLGPNGERMSGGQAVLNAQTGQRVGEPPGGAAPSQQRVAGETYTDAKGNKAKWDGSKFVSVK